MRIRSLSLAVWVGVSIIGQSVWAQASTAARVGAGQIWLAPKPNAPATPKAAPYRTDAMAKRALPTNTWYSSLAYMQWSDVLHAHPLSFKATEKGLEMGVPQKEAVAIERVKAWGGPPAADAPKVAVVHTHVNAIRISPQAFQPESARLGGAGDWNIAVDMNRGEDQFRARILHGSPYGYFTINRGDAVIDMAEGAQLYRPDTQSTAEAEKYVRYFSVGLQNFAIYASKGSQLTSTGGNSWLLKISQDAPYFSVAALPDLTVSTREKFAQHAFAFVESTKVTWSYDEKASQVKTSYAVKTKAMDGKHTEPLLGVYVHQQQAMTTASGLSDFSLPSVRGPIRFIAGHSFETQLKFNGLLPMWPKPLTQEATDQLEKLLIGDKRRAPSMFTKMGNGTYWTGKMLGAIAQLMSISEQIGDKASALEMEGLIKKRMETWFSGQSSSYFAHDAKIGTVIGYPEEYFSVSAMNDHHFHYGYWIMAAAHLARRDPNWVSQSQWGGMVDLLIRDVATAERGRADFPFIRNFDVYEGHSWARGNSEFFGHGNDQESSSEAINAWAALAMFGEFTGNKPMRDLGIYLYTTEISSVLNYWYDMHDQVFDKTYQKPMASMVFGGGYAYSTWWTEEPRQIQGINLLPITPASAYLAQLPKDKIIGGFVYAENARKIYDSKGQSDGTTLDIWQDIFASALAIADPALGMQKWKSKGSVELGDTRTRTFHWLSLLNEMGSPNLNVTADTMMYGVFDRANDGQRTYVAYNAGQNQKTVTFSDGYEIVVPSGQLVRMLKAKP